MLVITSALVFGAALGWMIPAGASTPTVKYSDSDCEVVTSARSQPSAGDTELENLAGTADSYESTAGDISDKKLKKGLLLLADVYEDASNAKDVKAASTVLVERAKDHAKGYKVYAKALTQCLTRSLPKG